MDLTLIYTIVGFGLAGYSVIANDSIQTLGTFIASKKKWFAWYILAGSASSVMIIALACSSIIACLLGVLNPSVLVQLRR